MSAGRAWRSHFQPIAVIGATEPRYPSRSVATGVIILKVIVRASGAIDHVRVIHGIPSLTEEAQSTVLNWKFRPAELITRQ